MMLESFGISDKKFKVTRRNDTSWTLHLYALPYLVYGGLAVYGLVTLTMENLVQSFFYGSIISFWLTYHIINLTFLRFSVRLVVDLSLK